MSRSEHSLYVPYVSGAVWVVRHAHTVVAQHASRREAIEDARRRAAKSVSDSSGRETVSVQVQADDGSWHALDEDEISGPDAPRADAG